MRLFLPVILFSGALIFLGTGCEKIENDKSYLLSRPAQSNPIGPRCDKNKAENCLAVHYVTYLDAQGLPAASEEAALQNLEMTNAIYSPCRIQFQIDNYDPVNPSEVPFPYNTDAFEDLDRIRFQYGEYGTLLIVTTGDWAGALRAKGANAWTQPPVANIFGVVLEAKVANYSNIIAHEIGHYLNLYHVEDTHNVLNPVVYPFSSHLTASQCTTARDAIDQYWPEFRR